MEPTYRAVDSPHNTPHLLIFNAKAFGWSELATGLGPLVDLSTARAVRALRRTRTEREQLLQFAGCALTVGMPGY